VAAFRRGVAGLVLVVRLAGIGVRHSLPFAEFLR
jgi:hypothetical protein